MSRWATDEELRQTIKKLDGEVRQFKKNYDVEVARYWNARCRYRRKKAQRDAVRCARGKRKGKGCPALQKNDGYFGAKCIARRSWTISRTVDDVFTRHCCTCRLTHTQARTKAALNKIGVT